MSPTARGRRWPLLTLTLVACALVLELAPVLAARLSFERELLATGPWRFFTGHLVHGQGPLAAVDLLVLAALGSWWEVRSRIAWVSILCASAVLTSVALLFFSSFASYVGSSALTSGLFVAAALELARDAHPVRRRFLLLALALFVGKCALESSGQDELSLVPLAQGTRVAACAHWAGGLGGALVALIRWLARRRVRPAADRP